jgi:hypothetical protein
MINILKSSAMAANTTDHYGNFQQIRRSVTFTSDEDAFGLFSLVKAFHTNAQKTD